MHQNHSPLAYKYFLLTTHYRKEVSFSYEALLGAEVAYQKLVTWCSDHKTTATVTNETYLAEFEKALYDDLATPSCIATMWKLIKDDTVSDAVTYATIIEMGNILGLPLHSAKKKESESIFKAFPLADKRKLAKEAKDYAQADELRKEIEAMGFIIKDNPDGSYSILEM